MTLWTKTLVFAVLMVSAVALGSYTLVQGIPSRGQGEARLVASQSPINNQPVQQARKPGPRRQPALASRVSAPAATIRLRGVSLGSLNDLKQVADQKQTVFLVLPGGDEQIDGQASERVGVVVGNLAGQGRRVGALTLRSGAGDYRQLVKAFDIKTFPTVVVMGGGCLSCALTGEITAQGLVQAFGLASNPVSSCTASGGAAGCCPPKK